MAVLNLITEPAAAEPFRRYGVVYLITNLVNGKQYVGQTISTAQRRLSKHFNDNRDILGRALHKYGRGSFITEELYVSSDKTDLDRAETDLIMGWGTLSPAGYNIRSGGGRTGSLHPMTRDKLRAAALARPVPIEALKAAWAALRGRVVSEEERAKRRASMAGHMPSPQTLKASAEAKRGTTHRPESVIKMRDAKPPGITGVKGVAIDRKTGRFVSRASIGGYQYHLGIYATIEEASARRSEVLADIDGFLSKNGRRVRISRPTLEG